MSDPVESLFTSCLILEYKYVQKFCPLGIYVLPTAENNKIWNGNIIINDGLYKGAKFKFDLFIPKEYPAKVPEVVFTSEAYHPLINPSNGELDIEKRFNNWQPGKNIIVNILFYIKDIFFNPIYLAEKGSFNPSCAKTYTENIAKFTEEIRTCVEKNRPQLVENKINKIIEKIKEKNSESSSMNDKIVELANWFNDNYKEIANEYNY